MFQLLQRMHQQPKDVAAGNCLRQLALSKNAKRNCQVKLPNTERNHRMPNGNAECRMKIPNAKGYAPKASIFHPVIIFYADRGTLARLFGPALFGRAPSAVRLSRPAASALSTHRETYTEGFCRASSAWRWKLPAGADESECEGVGQ